MKPYSLNILYEDTDIIVCTKPHGLATQSKSFSTPDLEKMLLNHIAKSNKTAGKPYLAVIHRLDQPVAGVLVLAKTPFAAKELNKQLQQSGFGKHYYALVSRIPKKVFGTLENHLIKDGRTNHSRVCSSEIPGAKLAKLSYQVIPTNTFPPFSNFDPDNHFALLDVKLDTGRHHQIRVQLSHMGCPIVGDTKYNPAIKEIHTALPLCLCAYKLSFKHPRTHKEMTFLYK